MKTVESNKRSLAKTLSWRVIILVIDFLIAYLFTQDVNLAGKFALIKLFIATAFYYLHERFWNKVGWGRS